MSLESVYGRTRLCHSTWCKCS